MVCLRERARLGADYGRPADGRLDVERLKGNLAKETTAGTGLCSWCGAGMRIAVGREMEMGMAMGMATGMGI